MRERVIKRNRLAKLMREERTAQKRAKKIVKELQRKTHRHGLMEGKQFLYDEEFFSN